MRTAVKLKGVLLDVDGTLVDSNDAHARAWVEAFARKGVLVPFETVRGLIGMGSDKLIPAASDEWTAREHGDEIAQLHTEIFHREELPRVKPLPRVRELLTRLDCMGLRLMAASSASRVELEALLKAADIGDLLHGHSDSDAAGESKPSPDILDAALAGLGAEPDEAVFIGDTRYDDEAAREEGMPFIGFLCGGCPRSQLPDAVELYRDPADLLENLERSLICRRL